MFHFMFLGDKPKYVDDPGVCHMDELFYMYNVEIPLLICDLEPTLSKNLACTGVSKLQY